MSKKGKPERVLDVVAAARRLDVRLDTLYILLRGGRIPGAEKREGRWVIPVSAIEDRLQARRTQMRSATPTARLLVETPEAARTTA